MSLGKYGSFPANQILGRPFYLTFEILDAPDEEGSVLRIVHAAELHAENLISGDSGEADGEGDEAEMNGDGAMRSNRDIVDTRSTQKLTLDEIEELKKESAGAGREIVAKLLESHSAIDQKTAFSLAKYTLRKRKKYIKRFTALPVDVSLLTNYMLYEKDAPRIMELRDELVGLIGCWGNVHHGGNLPAEATLPSKPNGRYLVVDETGGLVVAAMAERMGILYPDEAETEAQGENIDAEQQPSSNQPQARPPPPHLSRPQPMSASGNSITVLHAHATPSLALLKYFGYDQDSPDHSHPLYTHLKSVSWMQLVDPESDPIYANEPPVIPDSELATYKANKRSGYYRKRNRWARVRSAVDESRAGGFDGLIVASVMEPASIMKHVIPLLSGAAPVVMYSPTVEPLAELAELYSTPRRAAYINRRRELEERARQQSTPGESEEPSPNSNEAQAGDLSELEGNFPVDPTLLLAPTLQTSRVRPWQVLPGRTHPMMSGRGGAEGYIFHATRALPARDSIQARRSSRKKRKIGMVQAPNTACGGSVDMDMKT